MASIAIRSAPPIPISLNQWSALAELDAAGRYSVGGTGVGFAFSDSAGPVRTLLATAGVQPQTPLRLGAPLLLQVQRWFPTRPLVVVADGASLPCNCCQTGRHDDDQFTCVTRLRLDARLFRPAPPRKKGVMGRPPLVGSRLPSLQQILVRRSTVWQLLNVNHWYGEAHRSVEVASGTAIWYHTGLPPVPIRWVLVRDPKGKFETRALLCTQLDQQPGQILQWFLWRWQVEVTFQEVRAHLGVETQRQWSHLAIARTTPVLLGLFSIVTLLAHRLAHAGQLPFAKPAGTSKHNRPFLMPLRCAMLPETGPKVVREFDLGR